MAFRPTRVRELFAALVMVACWLSGPLLLPAMAGRDAAEFASTLADDERQIFEAYIAARSRHEQAVDRYWAAISDMKAGRKRKRGSGEALMSQDFVQSFPPEYTGKQLPPSLAKRWEAFLDKRESSQPPPEPKPDIAEFLDYAREQYGFIPERVPEREFKRRYAAEALALGLTKDQVVRVYALETSGLGTAEMVAGIHPIRKTGTPISTAIGYAQLLAANTISELVKSGPNFTARLRALAARSSDTARKASLLGKAEALGEMAAVARSMPDSWDRHMAFARTPKGLGMHAINVDGDIGPWLQVIKLKGLQSTAAKKGRTDLTGAEIELMNLAGPGTGLEMMLPAAKNAPTPNFFARAAYWRNTIVRGKTASELLAALDERMDTNIKNPGAIEFAAVFDELSAQEAAGR